jgi:hypothetical protein
VIISGDFEEIVYFPRKELNKFAAIHLRLQWMRKSNIMALKRIIKLKKFDLSFPICFLLLVGM